MGGEERIEFQGSREAFREKAAFEQRLEGSKKTSPCGYEGEEDSGRGNNQRPQGSNAMHSRTLRSQKHVQETGVPRRERKSGQR